MINDGTITEWNGRRFMILALAENIRAMKKSAIAVQREAKKLTGVGGGKPHQPSLPLEPPHRDTGALTNSITYKVVERGLIVEGFVGVDVQELSAKSIKFGGTGDVDYGYWLEIGTKKMSRRPYLMPALTNCFNEIKRFFREGFK